MIASHSTERFVPQTQPPLSNVHSLTPESKSQLRQLLFQGQIHLQRLETELASAVARLDNLHHERNTTRRDIETYLSILSPIQHMPIYIVQEIFLHCLPTDRFSKPAANKAPLSLAQVCSSWRNLVLSTPMLWSSLFVILGPGNVAERTELAALWFQRSAQHPLDISIYAPSVGDQLYPLLSFLSTNFRRVRHLSLIVPSSHISLVCEFFSKGAPSLSSLDVTFSKVHNLLETPNCTLRITQDSAPRLRSITWCTRNRVSQSFTFDATSIVDLNIDQASLTADQCLQLLQQCLGLKKAQLQVVTSPIMEADASKHVVHHALNSLSIHSMVALGSLFDHLTLPCLTSLSVADANLDLESATASAVWQPSAFTDFVERSQCDIASLRFSKVLESDHALISCLQAISHSLTHLQLSDLRGVSFPFTDRVLQLLTVRDSADGRPICLCPKLETVKFGTCLLSTDGVLAAMIESRWIAAWQGKLHRDQVVARPRSMNPRLDAARNPQDVAMLYKLRDAGLRVV